MIKHKQHTETKTYDLVDERVCDLCGGVSRDSGSFNYDWYRNSFKINNAVIELNQGSSYPEGGHRITTTCDLCPECMATKVIPWLESQGVKMREEECDW